jgi:hypothetical protein
MAVSADKKGKILRPKIVDDMYSNRYNYELYREFNSPNVIGVVKSNKLRYAEHIIRGAEDLKQRALFKAVLEGRRNPGRPKSRRVDGVNSDSRALGARDST